MLSMPRAPRALVLTLGAVALATAACGSVPEGAVEAEALACPPDSECYDPPRAVGEGGAIAFDTVEFEFINQTGLPVEGDLEVTLDNIGEAEHNILIEGANQGSATADEMTVQPGNIVTGEFNVFASEYVYYCTIPGHRSAGMEGVLTVYATPEEAREALGDVETMDPGTQAPADAETADPGSESPTRAEPSDAATTDA
jgi:hypothetical protein